MKYSLGNYHFLNSKTQKENVDFKGSDIHCSQLSKDLCSVLSWRRAWRVKDGHRAYRGPVVCTRGPCGAEGTCVLWRDQKTMLQKRKYMTFYAYSKSSGERDALSKDVQKYVELQCFWHTTAQRWLKLRGNKAHFISDPETPGRASRCISFGIQFCLQMEDKTGTISLSLKRYISLATVKALTT